MRHSLLSLSLLSVLACATTACQTSRSFLIADALVVDGSGAPGRPADVRIKDGRIVEIGELEPMGDVVVQANGLTLAPGFIDTHSHHAGGFQEDRTASDATSQGITTIISGQDGGSDIPLAKFFHDLEAMPPAINVAAYSGHNSIREQVMGEDYKRQAGADEIGKMRRLLAADMDAGALGLSTGLEYDPGIYSSREEVLTLAREAAAHGGRYISHMRSEDRNLWEALDEIITIGREAKLPVQVSHAKLAMTDWWGQAPKFLAQLDAARAEGIDATLDVYPYTYWQSTLTVLWPQRDFANRATAEYVLEHLAPAAGLIITGYKPDPGLVGLTLEEIAKRRGVDAAQAAMDLIAAAEKADTSVRVMGRSMDPKDIDALIAWPHANISSDGSINDSHPRGAGAFTRVLREQVRERKTMTLETAIHHMTGLAADHLGITDRGYIRPGAKADLVLLDSAIVSDKATIEDPGAQSVGIAKVWVNGVLVFADGKATGAYPGEVIRREAGKPAQ